MSRKIKFERIRLNTNGKAAILSTVELEPGLYETMLASPDFETEYKVLRTTSEAQAIADFNHLLSQYAADPLTGKYADLAKELECAAAYGLECAAGTEDGGTCNLDAVAVKLKGWNRKKVEQAAAKAGVGCFIWNGFGQKMFVFTLHSKYQGNARTAAAEAMKEALKLSGYQAEMYYQID